MWEFCQQKDSRIWISLQLFTLKTHIFNDDLCVLGLFLFKVRDDCLPTHVQEDLHSTERRRYGCLLVDFLFSDVDAHLDQSMGYVDVIY